MNKVGPCLPETMLLECVPDDDSGHRLVEAEEDTSVFVVPVNVSTAIGWNDESPLTASGRVAALRRITPTKGRARSFRLNGPALVEQFVFEIRHWLGMEREGFAGERNRRQELAALILAVVAILIVLASTDLNKELSPTTLSSSSGATALE